MVLGASVKYQGNAKEKYLRANPELEENKGNQEPMGGAGQGQKIGGDPLGKTIEAQIQPEVLDIEQHNPNFLGAPDSINGLNANPGEVNDPSGTQNQKEGGITADLNVSPLAGKGNFLGVYARKFTGEGNRDSQGTSKAAAFASEKSLTERTGGNMFDIIL